MFCFEHKKIKQKEKENGIAPLQALAGIVVRI